MGLQLNFTLDLIEPAQPPSHRRPGALEKPTVFKFGTHLSNNGGKTDRSVASLEEGSPYVKREIVIYGRHS